MLSGPLCGELHIKRATWLIGAFFMSHRNARNLRPSNIRNASRFASDIAANRIRSTSYTKYASNSTPTPSPRKTTQFTLAPVCNPFINNSLQFSPGYQKVNRTAVFWPVFGPVSQFLDPKSAKNGVLRNRALERISRPKARAEHRTTAAESIQKSPLSPPNAQSTVRSPSTSHDPPTATLRCTLSLPAHGSNAQRDEAA